LGEPSAEASRLLGRETKKVATVSHAQSASESQFLIYERRRFGHVIAEDRTEDLIITKASEARGGKSQFSKA
jgi:hypothetical protein